MKPAFFLLCLLLVSCKSTSKKDSAVSPRLAERLGKWDTTKRSQFENQMPAGGVNKQYKTSGFREKSFKGTKSFNSGKDGFKTATFSQANKQSRAADQTFSGANDQSRMSDSTFKTRASEFAEKESSSAGKSSPMADDAFKIPSDSITRKALETSKRPYIKELTSPGYTEDEVKGILNKK